MSNKLFLITMFPSTKGSIQNYYDELPEELVIATKSFEEIVFDNDWTTLDEYANRCKREDRKLVLFVNHEIIKWEQYDITMAGGNQTFNLLEILDKLNMLEITLVDAGLYFEPLGTYRTLFKKHIANIWLTTSAETIPPFGVEQWIFHEEHDERCHVLEDLDYITYPCYSFLARTKTHRIILYAEGNRLGWWQTNPYLTFNDCNLYGEQQVYDYEAVANTYYNDNPKMHEFLYNFRQRKQGPAPTEHYFENAKHYPFAIGGAGFHPSSRTFQETLISLSMESETKTKNYFITEKTCHPIWNLCPVTVVGQPGINKYLTTIGFDMFPDIIDWNKFDHIEDTEARAFAFTSAVNDLHENFDSILNKLKADKTKYYTRLRNNWKNLWKIKNRMTIELLHDPLELINSNKTEQEEFHNLFSERSEI